MFVICAQGYYEVLNTFHVVIGDYLGVADCAIHWQEDLRSKGLLWLLGSLVFAGLGAVGFTQGPAA